MAAMGDLVNLNRARKDRDRRAARLKAAENRIAHGRTRNERETAERLNLKAGRALDGHRLSDEGEEEN